MKINLIIVAMEEELNGVLTQLKRVKKIDGKYSTLYEFKIKGETYLMTLGKIGKVATAYFIGYLSSIYDIKRIFNVGTSGALKDSVKIGDIIIATQVIYHDVDVTSFNYEIGRVPSCPRAFAADEEYLKSRELKKYDQFNVHRGLIISGDTFVNARNVNKIDEELLYAALGAEMEAGAVAQCSYLLKIPFVIIRSVSDVICNANNKQEHEVNLDEVSINAGKVLLDLIS